MIRKSGRKHGEVFTNLSVVKFILDEVDYIDSRDLRNVKILEPASGKGAFATEIIQRLFVSSQRFGFEFENALQNIFIVELDSGNFTALRGRISTAVALLSGSGDAAESIHFFESNFLTLPLDTKFDCIVGNPPYIRHEVIPEKDKVLYKNVYRTFKYRADLYVPFFEKSLSLLDANGKLCFICSNRWLNNQYGKELRNLVSTRYQLLKLVNIEKSSPFDEAVTAYPCITTIQGQKQHNRTLYFESQEKEIDFDSLVFESLSAPVNHNWDSLFVEYDLNHLALQGIKEQGFEIGIGVATGADSVFIRKKSELNGIEKNRVLPLLRSADLKEGVLDWSEHYVINPFEEDKLCELDQYPHLKAYLEENKETLVKRHVSQKAPENWYKTIDKIKGNLLKKPKLLLPDLAGSKYLLIDEGKYYPHHNLYYITGPNEKSLKVLAAILMSDFSKRQMSQIGIRMNGGLPRYQAQSLKKMRIPNLAQLGNNYDVLAKAYDNRDFKTMNHVLNNYLGDFSIV